MRTWRGRAAAVVAVLAAAATAPAAAADWEMQVTDDGGLAIAHRQAPVVTAHYVFWGENWQYAGAKVTVGAEDLPTTALSAQVELLGLKVTGQVTRPAASQLRYAWTVEAQRELKGIVGGGLEFNLVLDSPSFGGKAPDPALLDANTGWRWCAAAGQEVRVQFDKPAAAVYFERGNRSKIRAMIVGQTLPAGRHEYAVTVTLPPGGQALKPLVQRYGPAGGPNWWPDALAHDASPVDLSFLNDKPAGKHGFVQARGDRLVFADGTPARFWGGNIAAYAIFADKDAIQTQARRIARLGYNLMRFHHHDSMGWVGRTVIDKTRDDSQQLDEEVMDRLDWWIKCLRDEGVYVWLDLHVGRLFKEGDGIGEGFAEMARRSRDGKSAEVKGFCYLNERIEQLMKLFNARYLSHVSKYTNLAYKDDPAVMGLLITNENDLTAHFGNLMLPDKNNPWHQKAFEAAVQAFAQKHGLPLADCGKTWLPGPSKLFLTDWEHQWNRRMLDHLRSLAVKVPVATTQMWGDMAMFGLPPLTAGGIIDVHSYGRSEALSSNPRYSANYVTYLATGALPDKPMSITEWNVPYPSADRSTAPLYVAAISALQGWDAPMIYNYSQEGFSRPTRPSTWSTYFDPALTAIMPAAAVIFRRDVEPARNAYCLALDRQRLYYEDSHPRNLAALRTLVEQSKVCFALPDAKELDWDAATTVPPDATSVTDLNKDFIPPGQDFVRSDTGQVTRNWVKGWQMIDTPASQAACGWIGGEKLATQDLSFDIATPKAAIAVTSLDGKPIAESRRILITAVARAVAGQARGTAFLSEPVVGQVSLRAPEGLTLTALKPDGAKAEPLPASYAAGRYAIQLTDALKTHWLMLGRQ